MQKTCIILLALPMLQPPGFCVCQLTAFAGRGNEPATAARGTVNARTCNCRNPNCRHRRPDSTSGQTQGATKRDHLPDRTPEPDHSPGCPAHPAYAINRAATYESPALFADLFVGGLIFAWTPSSDFEAPDGSYAAQLPLPAASPPLFLLVCDFRC